MTPRHSIASRVRGHVLVAFSLVLAACGSDDITAPAEPPTAGLLAFLPFASDASDASGNGNHGTLLAGASASGALTLGAADDALAMPSATINGLDAFTIGAWIRLDVIQTLSNQFVSGAIATDDNQFGIWYQPTDDRWEFDLESTSNSFGTNTAIEDGAWHHFAVTLGGGSARNYIDGVLVGAAVPTGAVVISVDPGGFIIGQDQDTVGGNFDPQQSLAGQIDNLRIYNRALTAGEVLLLAAEAH